MLQALGLKPKAVRTTVTANLEQHELARLLNRQRSDQPEEQDPDRIQGLGYAA